MANECSFQLWITQKIEENVWWIIKLYLDNNYLINSDLFQFKDYKSSNSDFDKAFSHAISFWESRTKYKQAQQIILTHNMKLLAKTYWNLVRNSELNPKEKIQVTLDNLEAKWFYFWCLKKYLVENNIRESHVIVAFLFCLPELIKITSQFISRFLI